MKKKDASRIVYRWAGINEGPTIQAICRAGGWGMTDLVDWTQPLARNWILAETTKPIGCIMVNFGAPFGRLEYLMILPDLPSYVQHKVLRNLSYAGAAQLKKYGSQVVNFDVRSTDSAWRAVWERRGAVCVGSGNFFVKKV